MMHGHGPIKVEKADLIKALKGIIDTVDVRLLPPLTTGAPGPGRNIVKTVMFPQPEVLFTFKKAPENDPEIDLLKESRVRELPVVLAGIRPCDARSIYLNSRACKEDSYFMKRMAGVILIGLLCARRLESCFCEKVGTGPGDTRHMDIAMKEEGDALLLFPLTPKGVDFFNDVLIGALDLKKVEKINNEKLDETAIPAAGSYESTVDTLLSRDLMTLYKAPFWNEIKDACLNCGICTFLCPTCYCFDIQDEVMGPEGRRLRYWDSCMFPLFTLHASGHNPRGEKIMRVRNRFMHKFKYFPERFGDISCVGCGRCIRDCPVNIDVREVIKLMVGVA